MSMIRVFSGGAVYTVNMFYANHKAIYVSEKGKFLFNAEDETRFLIAALTEKTFSNLLRVAIIIYMRHGFFDRSIIDGV